MKIAIKVSVFLLAVILIMLILMAITSDGARASESENALASAVEQTLAQVIKKGYPIRNYEELISDFHQRLLLQINSNSDIKIEVMNADMNRGILDIKITETYQTVKGKEKNISCRKTVVVEAYNDDYKKAYRTITYYVGANIFSRYTVYDGGILADPGTPEMAGHVFSHWRLEESDVPVILADTMVQNDMKLKAVFK
jgi:hypothetical protein